MMETTARPQGVRTGFRCPTSQGSAVRFCLLCEVSSAWLPLTLLPYAGHEPLGCAGVALQSQSLSPLASAAVILPLQALIPIDAEKLACTAFKHAAISANQASTPLQAMTSFGICRPRRFSSQ